MQTEFSQTQGGIYLGPVRTGVCIATFHSFTDLQNSLPQGNWAPDDFFVKVAPGVDAALVVAMIVAYNDMLTFEPMRPDRAGGGIALDF